MSRISAEMKSEVTYNPLGLKPGDEVWMSKWRVSQFPRRTKITVDRMIVDTKMTGGKIHVRSPILKQGHGFDPTDHTCDYTSAITRNKQDAIRWIEQEIERLREILSPAIIRHGDEEYALFAKGLSSREILSARSDSSEIVCHEFTSYRKKKITKVYDVQAEIQF